MTKILSTIAIIVGLCNSVEYNVGEEFIISYRAMMKNDVLVGEDYTVSKALQNKGIDGILSKEYKIIHSCEFQEPTDPNNTDQTLLEILKKQKDSVLECLYFSGVNLDDKTITKDLITNTNTTLKITPKRVFAKIENGNIKLVVLERRNKE